MKGIKTMNDKDRSVFDAYAPKTAKLEVIDGGKPQNSKEPYKAYGPDIRNNRTVRLRIEYGDADQTSSSMSKAYLVEVLYTSKRYMSLIFTNAEFLLEGKNLDEVARMLDADQVKSLHCFNPIQHEKPDEQAPIITRVRRAVLHETLVEMEENEETGT